MRFNERKLYDADEGQAMCVITDGMAKTLMDRLWAAGIRPTSTGGAENE